MSPQEDLESAGLGLSELVPVSGGDFASAFRARTIDRKTVFVKTHPSPPADFFATEAAGLEMMKASREVLVPDVIAFSDAKPAYLIMEWIEPGSRSTENAEFGRSLARMHTIAQPRFGRPDGATTGSLSIPNAPSDKWHEFFWRSRLEPLLRIAKDRGALPGEAIKTACDFEHRLVDLVPSESPSLVHGDLWAGNRVIDSEGRSWLVDPAAHHNHREWDIAMMNLFGGFEPAVFLAYHNEYPLQPGYNERLPLFQLAPLIVHAIKFGQSYVSSVAQAISQIQRL